jgi:hypothetical protein
MGETGGTGRFSDELSQYSRIGLPITLSGRIFGFRVLFPHMYVPNGVVISCALPHLLYLVPPVHVWPLTYVP